MEDDLLLEFERESAPAESAVTLQELDKEIAKLVSLREAYEHAKKKASELNSECEHQENILVGLLEKAGRTSYEAEGIAKIIKCTQTAYKTPKTNDDKLSLFNYIKGKYGSDALISMTSINHQTLNGWAKRELEDPDVVKIPGLELPTITEYLQVRKK